MVPSSRSFCMMFLTTKQFLSIWPKMRWKWQKIGSLNLEVSSGLFGLGSSIWFNSRRPVKRPSTSLGKEYFWFWRSLFVRKRRRAALREKNGPHTDSSHTGTKYERCYSNLGPGSLGPRNKLKMPWAWRSLILPYLIERQSSCHCVKKNSAMSKWEGCGFYLQVEKSKPPLSTTNHRTRTPGAVCMCMNNLSSDMAIYLQG